MVVEPVLVQGGVKKKVKTQKVPSSSPVLNPEKESTMPFYPGEVNPSPAVMQPVGHLGQPVMFPGYPPAGFLPPLFPPWSHAVPPRPNLYPDVSMSAGVGQDGQPFGQPGAGVVNAGSQSPVVPPGDLCVGKVNQGGATGVMSVNMREDQADNNLKPEKEGVHLVVPSGAVNVTTREERVGVNSEVNLGVPSGVLSVNTREERADSNPEPEKAEIIPEAVYENIEEATGSAEQVSGDQGDPVKQNVVLDKYDDCTPKQSYRKTPFPPPSSSVPGGSSPAFEVRLERKIVNFKENGSLNLLI